MNHCRVVPPIARRRQRAEVAFMRRSAAPVIYSAWLEAAQLSGSNGYACRISVILARQPSILELSL
jgi:hypothetical protein